MVRAWFELKDRQFKGLKDMTDSQLEKYQFTMCYMQHLIKGIDRGYGGCKYMVDQYDEEWILIYSDDKLDNGICVNVTCDSNLAIVKDVMKYLD